ncbi:MAG: PAS domain-containing sensor histidine kinase [Rhodanobacteraceae bacterium]|nr:MAG: PAS domain-containing sensor histidine kinase [Rhodanobacteraceae bacterium]
MARTNADTDLFALLATGVARLDASLRIADLNAAFAEHTGFGRSRLHGQTLAALKPDGAQLHALARRALAQGHARRWNDIAVCALPGHEARLDFVFTPCADGVLVEVYPATPPAHAARTSETLRGFAHEVRNPLAAIAGAAQLLARDAGGGRQRDLARLITTEAARLATLAERLLGSRSLMAPRAVNLHAVLERAAELLQVERADVAITRDYDPSLPAWHGDPERLLQAVVNLTRNAVEANAQHLTLRSRAEAGWRDARGQRIPALRIEVEDDGEGVPEALAATLFEPLVSGRADGSGLGLALAREIAREHGGELTWQRRSTGSCFILLLPRHPHPAGATP